MQRLRIVSHGDGRAYFSGLSPDGLNELGSFVSGAASIQILAAPHLGDRNPTARRELAIILSGVHDYGVRGDVRRLFPGDVVVVDDLAGNGYSVDTIGSGQAISMRFPLAPEGQNEL